MDVLAKNIDSVLLFMSENNYKETTVTVCKKFLNSMLIYFIDNEISFSMEEAKKFLDSQNLNKIHYAICNSALKKLTNVYNGEEINGHNYPEISKKFNLLSDDFKKALKIFIDQMSMLSASTREKRIRILIEILLKLQEKNCDNVHKISYDIIIDLFQLYDNEKNNKRIDYHQVISFFLNSLYEVNLVCYGFTLIVSGLKSIYKKSLIESYHLDKSWLIDSINNDDKCIDNEQFLNIKEKIIKDHINNKYSSSRINTISLIFTYLYLSIDINNLKYCPKIGDIWLEIVKENLDRNSYFNNKRVISILNKNYRNEDLILSNYFKSSSKKIDLLPSWCKSEVLTFLEIKRKELLTEKSIDMYALCIYKFCKFIDELGIKSFENLSSDIIKNFNLHDIHNTPQGKNSYNSRIRKFLEYLCINKKVKNQFLYLSLPSSKINTQSLIIVLNQDQQKKLRDIFCSEDDTNSLRAKAITQLGLYMGIRSIDIVNLTIDNIDWENATIKIMQKKTKYEIVLPMPTIVVNAIYKYIVNERQESKEKKNFFKKKCPIFSDIA